tara:strand:- start:397 stop:834 length:438 start_codon:yes stop_codon:yes gene_type:complete
LVLFSSALEFKDKEKIIMNNLIIDAADKKIFFMLMKDKNIYSVSHENSKTNYEKIVSLIDDFLNLNNLKIENISNLYVNRGPGSFAGIRNSLAVVKAIYIARKINYYCFSFQDFDKEINKKYENIPYLCDKLKIKKNLIKPIYLS